MTDKQWIVRWGDIEVTADDLTAEEVAAVDARTGCGWTFVNAIPGPYILSNILAVLASTREGRSVDVAVKEIAAMSAAELFACLDVVPVSFDLPPSEF